MLYLDTIANLVKKSLVKQQKQSIFLGIIWNLGVILQFTGVYVHSKTYELEHILENGIYERFCVN